MDMAIPGYDVQQYSLSNVCGKRAGTGFTRQSDSFICGEWYKSFSNTSGCKSRCSRLPATLRKGCELFSTWGWRTGNPDLNYQVVACPQKFKEWVSKQFGPNGVRPSFTTNPTTRSPTAAAATTRTPTNGGSVIGTVRVEDNNIWYAQLVFSFGSIERVTFEYTDSNSRKQTVRLDVSSWSLQTWKKSLPASAVKGSNVKISVKRINSATIYSGTIVYNNGGTAELKSTSSVLSNTL